MRKKRMLLDALEKEDYVLASEACRALSRHMVGLTPEEKAGCRLAERKVETMRRS
jgi:hypothetical protein